LVATIGKFDVMLLHDTPLVLYKMYARYTLY